MTAESTTITAPPPHRFPMIVTVAAASGAIAGALAALLALDIHNHHAAAGSIPANPLSREARSSEQNPAAVVELTGVKTAEQLMAQVAAALKLPVHPHWEHMTVKPESPVRFDLPRADLATTFRLLNSQKSDSLFGVLDYRLFPDHVEVATSKYFDGQEVASVNYDLSSLVRAVQTAAEVSPPPAADEVVRSIIDTIQSNVSMEDWNENGGDLAKINVVGSGLLVSAPKRFHPQIAWVLDQIERTPGWTTGLQRLLAPAANAAAGMAGTANGPPPTAGSAPTGP